MAEFAAPQGAGDGQAREGRGTVGYVVHTLAERPDLIDQASALFPKAWPRFMLEDAVATAYWGDLARRFAPFQVTICTPEERVIATGHTIPLTWDRTPDGLPAGWDAALERGVGDQMAARTPTTLAALAATIDPDYQGRGVSRLIIGTMRGLAARHGFADLIAPVRPSLKSRYPLTPIERYIRWRHGMQDNAPFDPWLRTHWRLGARVLRVAPASMTIVGTVAEWEDWARMRFPESGRYVVPGALEPVAIDCEHDLGRYVEPNVWMRHSVQASGDENAC